MSSRDFSAIPAGALARISCVIFIEQNFGLIGDLLPANGQRGGQWNDHRTTLNGIFWKLHTGAQWREIPERYGSWKSVYDRFNRWRRDGTIDRMLERLHRSPTAGAM